jgi:transposase
MKGIMSDLEQHHGRRNSQSAFVVDKKMFVLYMIQKRNKRIGSSLFYIISTKIFSALSVYSIKHSIQPYVRTDTF